MPSLDALLEEVHVWDPGDWQNDDAATLGDWWAVAVNDSIIAYFVNEQDAFRFRLDFINMALNAREVLACSKT